MAGLYRDIPYVVASRPSLIHEFTSLYTPGMKRAVRSRRKVYGQLLEHARRQPHRECCGILAGQDGLITQAFPAKNVAADPIRNYEIASQGDRAPDGGTPQTAARIFWHLPLASALAGHQRAFGQRHRACPFMRSDLFHCYAPAVRNYAHPGIFDARWTSRWSLKSRSYPEWVESFAEIGDVNEQRTNRTEEL